MAGDGGAVGAVLRKATYADSPRLFEIRLGVREIKLPSPTYVTVAECIRFIDASGGFWVWEEDGCVLGFSALDTRRLRLGVVRGPGA